MQPTLSRADRRLSLIPRGTTRYLRTVIVVQPSFSFMVPPGLAPGRPLRTEGFEPSASANSSHRTNGDALLLSYVGTGHLSSGLAPESSPACFGRDLHSEPLGPRPSATASCATEANGAALLLSYGQLNVRWESHPRLPLYAVGGICTPMPVKSASF